MQPSQPGLGLRRLDVIPPTVVPQPPAQDSHLVMESSHTTDLREAEIREVEHEAAVQEMDLELRQKLLGDKSAAARAGRRKRFIRALWGEVFCTLLFFTPIFSVVANSAVQSFSTDVKVLSVALAAGFQAIGNIFAFSSVSGAHFNPAISFALWLTGKLSNRKVGGYIAVQLLGSVLAMCLVTSMFHGDMKAIHNAIAVVPGKDANLEKVFATEFFLTFILTYVAFTVVFEDAEQRKKETMSFKSMSDSVGLTLYASTPQSKTGFAPFSIGFTIFSLSLVGGSSGGAFNPARLFGPALFSGKWDYLWLYWLGEILGASAAGLMVQYTHRYGLQNMDENEENAPSARDLIELTLRDKEGHANPRFSATANPLTVSPPQ